MCIRSLCIALVLSLLPLQASAYFRGTHPYDRDGRKVSSSSKEYNADLGWSYDDIDRYRQSIWYTKTHQLNPYFRNATENRYVRKPRYYARSFGWMEDFAGLPR